MTARHRKPFISESKGIASIAELWMLRILVPLGGHKDLLNRSSFSDDDVARAAGLGQWLDDEDRDFDASAIRLELRDLHRAA